MTSLTHLMLDSIPELLLVVDPKTLMILVSNAATTRSLGYTSAQIQGLTITDIEGSLQDVFYWNDVQGGEYLGVTNQDSQYLCANGDFLAVSKSISRLDHDGVTLLLLRAVLIKDERKTEDTLVQTASLLRATLESTNNGILAIGWQGRIDGMNRLFGHMWGLSDQLLAARDDRRVLDFVAQSVTETPLLAARLAAIVDGGETEDRMHHRDGRVFEVCSRPQYIETQIVGRVFSFHDITQRTLAETALRESYLVLEDRVRARTVELHAANATLIQEKVSQALLASQLGAAQSQLMQADRLASIGQLAAGVAHEINNPVAFVNSNLGTLQRYVLELLRLLSAYETTDMAQLKLVSPEIQQLKADIDLDFLRQDIEALLSESRDGLKRVTRIVQDLKDFSHPSESELLWADLEAGLDSTLRIVDNELKYKANVVKAYAGIPQIECFPFQLNQVFMNLLVNAMQALEDYGTITIRTGQSESHVWVEVQDTGKGMPPEVLLRIFEPFYTTKSVGSGTGLGLSVSYGIVKKHGGDIDIKSELGQGTVARINLPKTPVSAHTPLLAGR